MSTPSGSSRSSQNILLPDIAELFTENFLDTLLPPAIDDEYDMADVPPEASTTTAVEAPKNPMIDALAETANQAFTANGAPALSSTNDPTLDAFNSLSHTSTGDEFNTHLTASWKADPSLTLRLIWCLRSIPDGKGNRAAFYRAYAWLYEHHPRTAIGNLRLLAEPKEGAAAHGYWKDLLNILGLATVDELDSSISKPKFLNTPRQKACDVKSTTLREPLPEKDGEVPARSKADEHAERNAARRKEAQKARHVAFESAHTKLSAKLLDPKYRALYITVTRLFGERLLKDLATVAKLKTLGPNDDRLAVLKTISLVGKWAPTPGCSHDKITNISSALALYLHQVNPPSLTFPAATQNPQDAKATLVLLRQFFGKAVLKPLRELIDCPEPRMAAKEWTKIRYARVPSTAMKNNTERFFKNDPEGFQKYLIDVESGKKSISGATLFPHEIVGQLIAGNDVAWDPNAGKYPALDKFKKTLADTQGRVAEGQWKSLISKLKEAGKLDNAIAICDVSGSMGSLSGTPSKDNPSPIFVAVALSLVLSHLAAPPFNAGFITFSETPQYVKLDLEGKSLRENINDMMRSQWGMSTDLNAVFMKLLLPLAKKNNIKQEDMIKRLFIFSDMQFNSADPSGRVPGNWETNYDKIEKAYKEAGYEVPQIVYWDLHASPGTTVEVTAHRKGVAMMNGFSPSLLKVFMGEEEPVIEEYINEKGDVVKVEVKDDFTPVSVMKKALLKDGFSELKVLD